MIVDTFCRLSLKTVDNRVHLKNQTSRLNSMNASRVCSNFELQSYILTLQNHIGATKKRKSRASFRETFAIFKNWCFRPVPTSESDCPYIR